MLATPARKRQDMGTQQWSCKLPPTPGRSATTAMPWSRRWAAGPMPDSIKSCGEWMAPAHSKTSLRADAHCTGPSPTRYSTPVARPASVVMRSTMARVMTFRLPRFMAGSIALAAMDERLPLRTLTCKTPTPRAVPSLKSSTCSSPACCPAAIMACVMGCTEGKSPACKGPPWPWYLLRMRSWSSVRTK